jgi:2-methylcitrate dehydratase PrpD
MTLEDRLTQYVANLKWEDIPSPARDAVSKMLIDTVGVILAGLKSKECQNLLDRYISWGGSEESSVAGSGKRLPAPAASFLGGVFAHWWEWDDTHDDSAVHASAVIFPTLLAAAETAKLDEGEAAGREFVAATVASFDVACQIGATLNPHYHNGVMATGVPGHIGAAAGAARLLGLGEDGILSAMGLAAEQAGLSRQPLADRVNGKNILCGLAASQAIHSAFAAQANIKGSPNFLMGKFGLNAIFAEGNADLEKGLSNLGNKFSVTETSIKLYPSCRSTHPGLDLIFDMMADEPDLANRVDSIEVSTSKIVNQLVGAPFEAGNDPRVAAQFSIPYTLSVALQRGKIALSDFDPAQVTTDSSVLDMAKRVRVKTRTEEGPGANWWSPYTVKMNLNDGSFREREITALKGSLARPLTLEEQQAKLDEAGKDMLSPEQLIALADASSNIGKHGIAPVTKIMREANISQ